MARIKSAEKARALRALSVECFFTLDRLFGGCRLVDPERPPGETSKAGVL